MYSFEIKMNILLCIILLSLGCRSESTQNLIDIKWRKIMNTERPVLFSQIDSMSNGYVFSYSYLGTNQGFKILKVTDSIENIKRDILFESNDGTIRYVNVNKNNIGLIKYDFNQNTLNTSLIISNNMGKAWKNIKTPVETERAIVFTKGFMILEGNKNGTGETLKSSDMGETWNKINTLNKGFKSFHLLNYNEWYNNHVLCEGAKSFNQRNNKLVLLDAKKEHIKEFVGLKKGNSYVKIISKDKTLHGVKSKNVVKIYSLKKGEIHLKNKLNLPKSFGELRNVYVDDYFYMITGREKEIKGKTLTWVSCDKGKTWNKYKRESYQLVYNSFGKLIVKDVNNNILMGSLSVQ